MEPGQNVTIGVKRYLHTRSDRFKPLFIRQNQVFGKATDETMRLSQRSVQNIVATYARRCGLSIRVTPHTMRHSFATDSMINGADLCSVQEMMRHDSIVTTQIYTHVTNKHLREVHCSFHSRH